MSKEKYLTEKALEKKMNEYFDYCDAKEAHVVMEGKVIHSFKPYTVSGLLLALDISSPQFYTHYCKKYPTSTSHARKRIENYIEEGSLTAKIPTKAAEFNLKNNFKWQDKSIVENHNSELKIEVKSEKDKKVIDKI